MSSGPFPDRVDASKLFARRGRIEASLPLSRLTRLADYLADNSGHADVVLEFGFDADGQKQITGSITAEVQLACQRCLQALPTQLESEVSLLVFATRAELEKQLHSQGLAVDSMEQDVLVLDELGEGVQPKGGKHPERSLEQNLDVASLVEDELILSLPLVPMHEDVNCNREFNEHRSQVEQEESSVLASGEGPGNPFAVLAKLKKDADKPH